MIEGRLGIRPVSVAVLDLKAYLNGLASAEPTPGGGSAATLVGAFGAALLAMVGRITLAGGKHTEVHADAIVLVETADALRSRFVAARPEDEAAFAAVVEAQALPRASDAEKTARTMHLQAALIEAAEAPLRVAALAAQLLDACRLGAQLHNSNLMSDVECAVAFGRATLDASAANVRINHRYILNAHVISTQTERLTAIIEAAAASTLQAQAILQER